MQLVVKKACEQNEESIEYLKILGKYNLFSISQWKVGEQKKCTGETLPIGSSTKWSYFGKTLNRLVSYFNQYKACFEEICTTSKIRKTL